MAMQSIHTQTRSHTPSPRRAAESIRYRVPGAKLLVWHADVGSFRSVRAFADRVDASFPGGIDVLVNNAGVLNPPGGSHVTEDGIEVRVCGGGVLCVCVSVNAV
jgi:NAD(P)-dependent dehydrogenase (short-subunit alcohol dehydrogenase family)